MKPSYFVCNTCSKRRTLWSRGNPKGGTWFEEECPKCKKKERDILFTVYNYDNKIKTKEYNFDKGRVEDMVTRTQYNKEEDVERKSFILEIIDYKDRHECYHFPKVEEGCYRCSDSLCLKELIEYLKN